MTSRQFEVWVGLGLLAVFICWAVIDHLVYKARVRRNAAKPVTSVRATVVKRRVEKIRSVSRHVHTCYRCKYYVTYKTDDGDEMEFEVSEVEYDAYHSGRRGQLTYRTWEYLGFCPDRKEEAERCIPVAFADEDES